MLNFKYEKTLKKLRDILLTENQENFKMIQLYVAYLEGNADEEDLKKANDQFGEVLNCLLYTSPSPRDFEASRMPSSA